jgi:acetyl esterase/lipase
MEPRTHVYKVIRGCEICADIYSAGSLGGLKPAIVWIHGGALIEGNRKQISPDQLSTYLDARVSVVAIDYRLAPETKLPAIIEDLQDAFAWLRAHGPSLLDVDPGRIAVVGHSAGGYLALMSGWCVSPRPRAIVAFYGYGDIVGDWYSQPDAFYRQQPLVSAERARAVVGGSEISAAYGTRFEFYLYCRQQGRWPYEVGGREPEVDLAFFRRFCPVYHVTADYPPTMLLHGDEDTDVPYEESVRMAQVLAQAGVDYTFTTIPGGGHGFDAARDDRTVQDAFRGVLTFLQLHLSI